MDPIHLPLNFLREDEEFLLYRGEHPSRPGGKPLDRSPSEPGEPRSFLRIAAGLGNALGGLHKRGLVHENIKPANFLINGASSGDAADGLRHRFTLGARAPGAAPARDDSRFQRSRVSTNARSFSFDKRENSIWRGLW